MVPADRILDTAISEKVDFIGLSGLITPSLEEMVHVASEMERRKMTIPLLLGGATTSEIHAAVKVAPAYSKSVIHVKDASKAAGVLSSLMQSDTSAYTKGIRDKYAKMREAHASRQGEINLITLEEARKNRLVTDWKSYTPSVPSRPGHFVLKNIDLNELAEFIDWTFFFFSWKISGKYPAIFDDPVKGVEARKLYDDALIYIREIIDKNLLEARAVFGIYPASADGDDVDVYSVSNKKEKVARLSFLRNQEKKEPGIPNLSLSDYIAPYSAGLDDNIGLFVVTADLDSEAMKQYAEDDYASIMIRILSDRFAEAAAEWLHMKIRTEYWGYEKNEKLSVEDMLKVKYRGIRPAPGYPACPDHTEKRILFDLLQVEKNIGASLTENFAMIPPAAVSGYFFSHPASSYFNIGKLSEDQLADYGKRKNFAPGEAKKWLAHNL
jgi:5-methyltetrahydrofolate--homocysteine methyltransferase